MEKSVGLRDAIKIAGLAIYRDDWLGEPKVADERFLQSIFGTRRWTGFGYEFERRVLPPANSVMLGPLDPVTAKKLDLILGQNERRVMQRGSVITWLRSKGCRFQNEECARRDFDRAISSLTEQPKTIAFPTTGKRPTLAQNLEAAMSAAIVQGEYTLETFANMLGKEGVRRFGPASEGEINKAKKAVLDKMQRNAVRE